MYRMETGTVTIPYIGPCNGKSSLRRSRCLFMRLALRFRSYVCGSDKLGKIAEKCKNLKQPADIYLDGNSRKEIARKASLAKESRESKNRGPIPVSPSGAEFFLDKKSALAYHAAKFWGGFVRAGIFRLRGSTELINWPTCIEARTALPFGFWLGFIVGRERQLVGYRTTSTRCVSLREEESRNTFFCLTGFA